MGKQINEIANKTVGTIFVPASRRDTKSVFQVTQHFNTNKNNLKHYVTIGITIYYFINVPKHIVVNGNNILEAKNSKHHGVTPYVAHTHNRRLRKKLCVKLANTNIFMCTFNDS